MTRKGPYGSPRQPVTGDTAETDPETLTGSGWTLLAHGITRGITFAASLVLARLLEPSDFGVIAIATLLLTTLATLTGAGLSGVVVVSRLDLRLLETALMLLLVAGALGAAAIIGAAGPIADLFDAPPLADVLPVLAVTVVIGGLTTFYEAVFQRELRFRRLLLTQLTRALAYTAVAIAAAVAGAGVWSLVAGQLAGAVVYALALVATAPYLVRPRFGLEPARRAFAAGRGFVAHNVLTLFQHHVDVAAIAYMTGTRAAGFYSTAWTVAAVPYNAFTDPVAGAAFPAVAERHRRDESADELGVQLLAMLALFAAPAGVLISATADPLVSTLLGEKWRPAAAALAILGLWLAVVQVEAALGWFLNATGRAGTNAAISAGVTLPLIPALFVSAGAGGIAAVAWVMVASAVAASVALMVAVRNSGALSIRRQIATLQPAVAGCAVTWVTARLAVESTAAAPDAAALAAGLAVGAASYLATLRLLWPATLRRGVAFLKGALRELRARR